MKKKEKENLLTTHHYNLLISLLRKYQNIFIELFMVDVCWWWQFGWGVCFFPLFYITIWDAQKFLDLKSIVMGKIFTERHFLQANFRCVLIIYILICTIVMADIYDIIKGFPVSIILFSIFINIICRSYEHIYKYIWTEVWHSCTNRVEWCVGSGYSYSSYS